MALYRGMVCKGRGGATQRTADFADFAHDYFGKPMVRGTFNVVLPAPVGLDPSSRLTFLEDGRSLWPVTVEGKPALAYRWPTCPLHVIEIISPMKLREDLGVGNGEFVSLGIDDGVLAPTKRRQLLSWQLLWRWRETRYYSNNIYPVFASLLPVLRLESAQNFPENPQPSYLTLASKILKRVKGRRSATS
jgi:hypothetical protein